MSYLLDSDICSSYLRQKGIIEWRFLQYGGNLSISIITAGELLAWSRRVAAFPLGECAEAIRLG